MWKWDSCVGGWRWKGIYASLPRQFSKTMQSYDSQNMKMYSLCITRGVWRKFSWNFSLLSSSWIINCWFYNWINISGIECGVKTLQPRHECMFYGIWRREGFKVSVNYLKGVAIDVMTDSGLVLLLRSWLMWLKKEKVMKWRNYDEVDDCFVFVYILKIRGGGFFEEF